VTPAVQWRRRVLWVAASLLVALRLGNAHAASKTLHVASKAFTESDVDAIVNLYDSGALFLGTGSKVVVTKPEDIRKYFEQALLTNRPRGATVLDQSVVVLSDTVMDWIEETANGPLSVS